MKNPLLRSLLGLTLVAFTLLGCDKLEEADDVEFDIEVEVLFLVDENAQGSNVTYPGDPVTLSIAGNAQIQQYADKIKEVRIKKIEYSIAGYAAEPPGTAVTFSNGIMFYASIGAASADILTTVESVNLATSSGVHELPVDEDSFADLGALLLEEHEATIFTSGTLSSTPVQFNVPTTFTITIVADAL
jgi:hypothetical protein